MQLNWDLSARVVIVYTCTENLGAGQVNKPKKPVISHMTTVGIPERRPQEMKRSDRRNVSRNIA